MANRQPKEQLSNSLRSYVAKVVFTYTQTMGHTDRRELEELTDQVITRLEKNMQMEEQIKTKRTDPTLP